MTPSRILLLILLFFKLDCFAQSFTLSGVIYDENSSALPGVSVSLNSITGHLKSNEVTDINGKYFFRNLTSGDYNIVLRFLGYDSKELVITITTSDKIMAPIQLSVSEKQLSEILIKDKKPIAQILNDTVQYDATSFKVLKDASADELVDKIPSITRDQGVLKSQGEEVRQVLVDGKPFFGNDPNLSLKNLPAELIDKIQIFDQQNEQSQFSGINDGNTLKTINIVTKSGMNNGQFGKVYAGFGDNERYQLGGNFNYFDGDRRISLIGMSNNINIQNFSIDDILGAIGSNQSQRFRGDSRGGLSRSGGDTRRDFRGGSSGPGDFLVSSSNGISTTHAIGINITDKLGSKMEYTLSYFLNKTDNELITELSRNYYNDTFQNQYFEKNLSNPANINHRINGRFEYKIDSFNSILYRPRITFQSSNSSYKNENYSIQRAQRTNATLSALESNANGLNFSNSILFRHRFRKPGRTFSIDFSTNHAPKDEHIEQTAFSEYLNLSPILYDTIWQKQHKDFNKWNVSTNIEYTEPINSNNSVSINYRYSLGNDQSDLSTYDIIDEIQSNDVLNPLLSNTFESSQKSHQTGLGYQFNKPQKWNINIRTNWQVNVLDNDQFYPDSLYFSKSYYAVLPSLFARYSFNKNKNIHFFYRSNTQIPSVTQLQNVLDNSNPVQLRIGNPELQQSVSHNFNIRFTSNNSNATVLHAVAGGSVTDNFITNHLYIYKRGHPAFSIFNIIEGTQLLVPVNTKSSKQFRTFLSYTLALTKIKCNLSIDGSYIFSETPALVDDILYNAFQNNMSLGISLTSNISDKVDFNIQFRPSINTYRSSDIKDEYLLFDQRMKFNWLFSQKNIIRLEYNGRINEDLSKGYNQNIHLFNLVYGRKIFKNERGEISFGVYDLFNQNQNIQRTVSEYYIEDNTSNIIQRFLMLSFTYNIRHFNTHKKSSQSEFRDMERGHWR